MHTTTYTQRTLKATDKQNAKKRQIGGHMRAVLASVIQQYLPERYFHFFFSSDLHYNDWDAM